MARRRPPHLIEGEITGKEILDKLESARGVIDDTDISAADLVYLEFYVFGNLITQNPYSTEIRKLHEQFEHLRSERTLRETIPETSRI